MQTKLLFLSLGASLLGAAQAQQCMSDPTVAQSLLTCVTNIATPTSTGTNYAQASSSVCVYAKSVLSCYNNFCDGTTVAGASVFAKESSIYCNGNNHPSTSSTSSSTGTATNKASGMTASSTVTSKALGSTALSTMSTTATAGANSQSAKSSTASNSIVSNYSKGNAAQGHTMYVKEVVFVAVAGLIGELVL